MSRVGCIIQARMGSERLPGKVMMDLAGEPVLAHVFRRMKMVGLDVVCGAFPDEPASAPLIELAKAHNVGVYLGDEKDVLNRYYGAAKELNLDGIMRVTGDCPLIDPVVCAKVLAAYETGLFDFVANDVYASYPIGLGCEVFGFGLLERAANHCGDPYGREHVSHWMKHLRGYSTWNLGCPINYIGALKLAIDTQFDLDYVRAIMNQKPEDYTLAATLAARDRAQAAGTLPEAPSWNQESRVA